MKNTGFLYRVKSAARDIGLLDGHSDYTRFIILGRSGTGSNFVRRLLSSDKRIIVFGEIFRNCTSIGWDIPGYPQGRRTLSLFRTDPARFLEREVFRKMPQHISAAGFKIFYSHAQNELWKPVWAYLRDQENLKVIHLKRHNILKAHLSLRKAFKTDMWVDTRGAEECSVPMSLDYEDCLQAFTWTRDCEEKYDAFFNGNHKIDVLYEDLCDDCRSELKRIKEFLGVDVEPSDNRQSRPPLSKAISNYFELKERFRGTSWEEFFED